MNNLAKEILEKLLNSESLRNRKLHQDLLKYLIEAYNQGITPKEVTIAHDVFKKGIDFNSSEDTTVRVHMHKLRKMLVHYYDTEGKSDKYKLSIPKGHYKIVFTQTKKAIIDKRHDNKNLYILTLSILFCCSIIFIVINNFIRPKPVNGSSSISKHNIIWSGFFNNDYSTSIVIGDFIVFHEYNEILQRTRRIQDYEFSTIEEIKLHQKDYPELNIEEWFLGELPHNSLFNILDMQNVFLSYNRKFDIDFTTNIDIDYIKNRNIIYIGEFKNLRVLDDLMSVLPVQYETLPWWHGTISYTNNDSLITLKTSHDWNISRYVIDLAIVAKIPGQNNENYFIFTGFGYNSQIEIVDMYCHKSSLKTVKQQIIDMNGEIPDYFLAVYEVSGFDRASSSSDLKFFKEIDKDYFQNNRLQARP